MTTLTLDRLAGKNLDFAEGMVLSFKSRKFDLTLHAASPTNHARRPQPAVRSESYIRLFNENGDILLQIMFRNGQNKIWLNDCAGKCIEDGWGKERSVDLSPVDVKRWGELGVTISVHHYSTRSGFGQYQILFNLTTICYFDKTFAGRATRVQRSDLWNTGFLEESLSFYAYKISALRPEERQAILLGM